MRLLHFDLLLATANQHKIAEMKTMIPDFIKIKSLSDIEYLEELPETSGTIPGNATEKAREVWKITGMNCLSDDSGLCVAALNGEPGVDSAFYAGLPRNDQSNYNLLLKKMDGRSDRRAHFLTVMALIIDGKEFLFEGRVEGTITEKPIGNSGFGYDTVFVPNGYDITFAQMSEKEKNAISHRKNALAKVIAFLKVYNEKQEK